MQISRKADYGLRAVTILAALPPDGSLQAQELAEAGDMPVKFLEQILLALKKGEILRSKRGVGGGYRLNRESRLISVGEVIEAIDGELIRFSGGDTLPSFPGSSGLLQCLREAESEVNDRLRKLTIEDLVTADSGDAMVGYGI